jgi:RND family efflux transporter MFP subunit
MKHLLIPIFLTSMALCRVATAADYEATLALERKVTLGFQVSGNVDRVAVTVGQAVDKGALLASLDDRPYRATLTESRSRVTLADTEKTEAERDYRMATELYDRTVLSSVELENAKLKAQRSGARYAGARAGRSRAEYELEQTRLVAPFDGWVLDVAVQAGQTVISTVNAQPAITLAERGWYRASALLPGTALDALTIGQSAGVVVAEKTFAGEIKTIGMEPANGKAGKLALYEVGVEFHSSRTRFRAGQRALISFSP